MLKSLALEYLELCENQLLRIKSLKEKLAMHVPEEEYKPLLNLFNAEAKKEDVLREEIKKVTKYTRDQKIRDEVASILEKAKDILVSIYDHAEGQIQPECES